MGSFDAARRRIRRHADRARTAPHVATRAPSVGIADWLSLSKLSEALGGMPAGSPYNWHAWVYTCVRVRVTNLGLLPFGLFTGSAKKPRPVTDGPWVDLFRKPAPSVRGRELHMWAELYLCLLGEAFYVWAGATADGSVPAGRVPSVLQVFPGRQYATPVRDRLGAISAWSWNLRGKRLEVPADRVCQVRYMNPEDPERGLSPLDASALGIESDNLAARWNRAFFRNNATPSGALIAPPNSPPMDEDQVKIQKQRWKDVHGGADKNHDVAILSGGVTFQQFAPTHVEMGFKDQRVWNRDEIAACYQVPQFFLGLTTDLKYATARESRRILFENVLLPEAAVIQDCLEADLFHANVPAEERARASMKGEKVIWGAFDGSTVDALRDSHDERLARMDKLIAAGWTRNEANAYLELGLPEIPDEEGGNARTVSFGLALLDDIANPEPIDPPPPALPPKTNPPAGDPPGEKPKGDGEDPPKDAPRGHRCRGMESGRRRRLAGWLQLVTHAYAPGERAFLTVTRKHFRGIGQEILGLLTGDGRSLRTVRANPSELEMFLASKRREWDEALAALARPIYARAAHAGVKILEHQVPKGFEVVQATNPKILRFLAEKELKLVNVNETFLDAVRTSLVEGMGEQATVAELEIRLQREMQIQAGRSKNIARTETASATNGTRKISMQESEGIRGREWTTAGDDNVRESHVPLDGEVIPVDGTYLVGGSVLDFPGDPDAPPEEICMCRCSEGPVLES